MPPRAVRVLREVDLIAAEDTRHTGHLLTRFEIRKPMISYHQFSEAKRTAEFLQKFEQGQSIALVSDAGMPGVSDPGERLIRAATEAGIVVEVVPGPSATLLALAGSGFPMVPFYFGGFLPVKGGQRRKELLAAAARECTSIYFRVTALPRGADAGGCRGRNSRSAALSRAGVNEKIRGVSPRNGGRVARPFQEPRTARGILRGGSRWRGNTPLG